MTYSNKFFIILLLVFLFTIIPSCSQIEEIRSEQIAEDTINLETITYLALGDSYTVGESVANGGSFPAQLSAKIQENKNYKVNTTVIAQSGWRTDQLLFQSVVVNLAIII
ncbi:hypothetical protein [Maribacter litoralis]|uniref:hypothetical protein n=1 Tax=Maribacter litoralis TaxID=2059726 RepID=UPI003D2D7FE8